MSSPTLSISADFPFTYQEVNVLGSTMRYIEAGEGRPVLFLHGNPTSSYLWRNVIPLVAPVGRCIALDLIGMGASDKAPIAYRFADHARYLEAALDALALDDATLVLHDWGSALGFDWASRHESRVRGLAFMEAFLMPAPSYDVFPLELRDDFRAFRTPEIGWQLLVRENRFIEHVLPASVVRPLSERELDHYRAPFRDEDRRTPLWRWPNEIPIAGEPADVHATIEAYGAWLQRTPLPKLLIHADPGVLIPAPLVEWAQTHLAELTTVHVGRGIHYLQEDHPHAIGAALADWINETR
ncbi:MAG TPA: haloalkane dehalogenase [Solirubrobacter sp.]|nr:haloalkane dehalogenase [Solirubrobacter sp.]